MNEKIRSATEVWGPKPDRDFRFKCWPKATLDLKIPEYGRVCVAATLAVYYDRQVMTELQWGAMMRAVRIAISVAALGVTVSLVMYPEPAQARRYTFSQSHNGTDLFNPVGGAKTAATKKLMYSIELWQKEKGIRKVRIGKVRTSCGEWNVEFLLPHHRSKATARVCS